MNLWNFIREVCTVVIRKTHLNTGRFLWYKVCGSATVNMAKMGNCEIISVCTHWQNPSLNNQGPWQWERQWQNNFSVPPLRAGRLKVTTNATYPGPQTPSGLLCPRNFSPADGRVSAVPAVLQVTGYIPLCCKYVWNVKWQHGAFLRYFSVSAWWWYAKMKNESTPS